MSGSAGRQSLHDSDVDDSQVNDSAISLSSISVDRRAMSNDDSVTLKNCSSNSTLNGDVTRAPAYLRSVVSKATHRPRHPGLSTFNPFGCQQYSTPTDLQRAVPSTLVVTSDAGPAARTNKNPPNPPRRTSSLSSTVPPSRPSSAFEKISEIQKLASLADKLAANRRVHSRTLPLPRFNPPVTADRNSLFCEQSHVFTVERSTTSDIKTSHHLDLTASCLSPRRVANKEDDQDAVATGTISNWSLTSPAVVSFDDKSVSVSASPFDGSGLPQNDSSGSRNVSSQNSNSVNVATAENCTTSLAGIDEVCELQHTEVDDRSAQNDDNISSDPNVSREIGVSQATTLVSSVKDNVMTTAGNCSDSPMSVSARLIITSPVSSRACCVENPHRRSICKPLPHVDDMDSAISMLHHLTSSLRQRGDELSVFVKGCGEYAVDPTNGRSWYDVPHGDDGHSNCETIVSRPQGYTLPHAVAGFSLDEDYDTRSISSHSSFVSSKSSDISHSLQQSTSRRVIETSALNGDPDARMAVRINAPRPRTQSTADHCSINSTRSLSSTAADHEVSTSFAGVNVDGAVTKGINLKRLKRSKHGTVGQLKKDADVDLVSDTQRLSGHGWTTAKTTFSELPVAGSPTNNWLWGREKETETRPVCKSLKSSSLDRRKYSRTYNKSAEHCPAADNIIVSSRSPTGSTQY